MGSNIGSHSKGFKIALYKKEQPIQFIELISRLLGPKGKELKKWAEELPEEELYWEITDMLENGVEDEWQFLFHATRDSSEVNGTDKSLDGTISSIENSSDRLDRVINESKWDPTRIIGQKVKETAGEIADCISSSILSRTRRLILIVGPGKSGKTTILEEVCNRSARSTGITPMDFREQGAVSLFGKNRVVYMDDVDLEIGAVAGEHRYEQLIVKFYHSQNSYPVIVLTCRKIDKLRQVIEACDGIPFDIPDMTREELSEVLEKTEMGGYKLSQHTCEKVVNILNAVRAKNKISSAMDSVVHLLYPTLLSKYTGSTVDRDRIIECDENEILKAVSKATGAKIEPRGKATKAKIKKQLLSRIKGQERVIEEVTPMLSSIASGLSDPTKPSGSVFMYGPTGVGKTLFGEVSADILFNGRFHKEDMNTYSEKHSVSRLTGAPPGYIGYNDVPAIIEFIDGDPGVVLLDEIEKAHEDVILHVMELLDTGFIRDTRGNLHDARGFLIVMTSNVTFDNRSRKIGLDKEYEDNRDERSEIIDSKLFRKEFVARIQTVIKYDDLGKDILSDIAESILTDMSDRLKSVGIKFKVTNKVIDRVVKIYDVKSGARSMRTFVETVVKTEALRGIK